ncbi:hypothetical protein BASA81_009188 [Batrachochytrium salamandrivorans]|nr:hypothetical protein BASA81_009188 [Batrachochytrium salamandrivorans]
MPANTQEGVPPTPFARALLRICGQVFASATIPRAWLCASIVSIDKKDGDPLNPGDKRGIALINVGLKLVCKVLQMRIERFVETNNLLSYEQAGFRKREECVGQVVSLVDIIQRRQNAGLNTHVLFIDIRKAFDTVPVGALLWKLQNMGFPRRTLAFLKALYTSSSARARAGSLLSDPFPIQRGVRQGCPLSGLLFNLFINDILDGVAPITVPGLPRDTNPIRGLMYADDVAVFADSEQSLLAASTAIEQWANQWEMQFGVAKCGIISFTGHLAPRLDSPIGYSTPWTVGQSCGVIQWSWAKPTMGLSWLVATSHTSHLLQTTINKGIRLFTGARLSTAIGPLLVETGIGSLLTRSLVSRVRLLERSVTKRTPINAICSGTDNDVFTLNVQGQLVRSSALVLVSSDQTAIQEQILADTTSQTKDSQATTLVCIDGDSTNMWRLCIAPKIWTKRWLDGTVEHESMGTRHDNRALAARLADFLQVAYRQYQSTLWKYHRDRLVEVG